MNIEPTTYRVRARNTATESENRIHDDATAAQYGFRGGLVPGVTVYGYLTVPVVERFGLTWLERGSMHVKFVQPVYQGDEVVVRLAQAANAAQPTAIVSAESIVTPTTSTQDAYAPRTAVCAKATASIAANIQTTPRIEDYPWTPLPPPDDKPPAARESLVRGAMLGTLIETLGPADRAVLDKLDERLAIYQGPLAPAHPVRLLEMANRLLMHNFTLGPWIHAASEVQNFSTCTEGEVIEARGRIVECFERKGHEFVLLDVLLAVLLAGGGARVVQHVRHSAIYHPRFV